MRAEEVDHAVAALPEHGNSTDLIAAKQNLIQANASALSASRKALLLPYWNPPARSTAASFEAHLKFRDLARLFILDGRIEASLDDSAGAIGSFLDALGWA